MRLMMLALLGLLASAGILVAYSLWQAQVIATRLPPLGEKVSVDSQTIHFVDQRPAGPEKATLLLIHGASGNEADLRAALARQLVEKNYRVISVDRPGQGWSSRAAQAAQNSPAGQATIIHKAMRQHGVTKAIVVVHSLAGTVGLQMALNHTDFTTGLMMISPVSHPWPGGIATYYHIAASPLGAVFNYTLALPLGQALLPSAVQSVFAPYKPPEDYTRQTRLQLVLRPQAFAANARDVARLFDFVSTQWPRYKQIALPVSIVAGDADTIVITNIHSRNSAREIPGAKLTILPGVGHVPHWTHPAAVIRAIEDVFSRTRSNVPLSSR